jgi:peptidoglycan/xylan/chitin deacetylase (PgdA/CDA1 family)
VPKARVVLWAATGAGLALLGFTLLVEPVPLWLSVAAFFAYLALCTAGVLLPRLQMYANVISSGIPGGQRVTLTFDDGPHPETTRRVLAALASGGHRATFFVVGFKAQRYPEVVREICEQGHEVAAHGYAHSWWYSLWAPARIERDIERTRALLRDICGACPALFRPPVGHVSPRTAEGARRAGVRLVAWNVRALDGVRGASAERVARRVEQGLSDGAIVLLHDASERDSHEPAGARVLPRILGAIEARGLRSVTLSELIEPGTSIEQNRGVKHQGT